MPETARLHIQGQDTDPVRVVGLTGGSVRIGRGVACDVRLTETDVADEECRLRRRGDTWQLVPSRSASSLRIDGQSVEVPRPLSFGTPFEIGGLTLTLQPASGAAAAWSRSPFSVETVVPEAPAAPGTELAGRHRADWQSPPGENDLWLQTHRETRRWESRFRAAGEKLRAAETRRAARAPDPPARPYAAAPLSPTPAVVLDRSHRADALREPTLRRAETRSRHSTPLVTPPAPARPTLAQAPSVAWTRPVSTPLQTRIGDPPAHTGPSIWTEVRSFVAPVVRPIVEVTPAVAPLVEPVRTPELVEEPVSDSTNSASVAEWPVAVVAEVIEEPTTTPAPMGDPEYLDEDEEDRLAEELAGPRTLGHTRRVAWDESPPRDRQGEVDLNEEVVADFETEPRWTVEEPTSADHFERQDDEESVEPAATFESRDGGVSSRAESAEAYPWTYQARFVTDTNLADSRLVNNVDREQFAPRSRTTTQPRRGWDDGLRAAAEVEVDRSPVGRPAVESAGPRGDAANGRR